MLEKEKGREYIYKGKIINLRIDKVELSNGVLTTREIVEHPGAVAILPIDSENNVYLVEQFRKPIDQVLAEIPAGKLDANEAPLDCAIRELKEETGLISRKIEYLGFIYTTAGFSNEKIYLYLARDLVQELSQPDEDEILNMKKINIIDFYKMIFNNTIKDTKTISCALIAISKVNINVSDIINEGVI